VFAELGKERFMEKVLDVLGVVEGCCSCRSLGDLLLIARFSRIDTFEDTEPSEVWEGDLELFDGSGASNVIFGSAGRS
jgi:hypothetical protein